MTTSVETENSQVHIGTDDGISAEALSAKSYNIPKKKSTEHGAIVNNPSSGIISKEHTVETSTAKIGIISKELTIETCATRTAIIPGELNIDTGTTTSAVIRLEIHVETSTVKTTNNPVDITVETGTVKPKADPADQSLEIITSKIGIRREIAVETGISKHCLIRNFPDVEMSSNQKDAISKVSVTLEDSSAKADIFYKQSKEVDAIAKGPSFLYGTIQTETSKKTRTTLIAIPTKDSAIRKETLSQVDRVSKDLSADLGTSLKHSFTGVSTSSKKVSADTSAVSKKQNAAFDTLSEDSSAQSQSPTQAPGFDFIGLKSAFSSTCQKLRKLFSLSRILENSGPKNKPSSETNIPLQRSLPSEDSDITVCKSQKYISRHITIATPYIKDGNKEKKYFQDEYNPPLATKLHRDEHFSLSYLKSLQFALKNSNVSSRSNTSESADDATGSDDMSLQPDNEPLQYLVVPPLISPLSDSDNSTQIYSLHSECEPSNEERRSAEPSPDTHLLQSQNEDTQQQLDIPSPRRHQSDDNFSDETEYAPHYTLQSPEARVPPLFDWNPPTARRIRPPVAESRSSSDTEIYSFQSDSEPIQHAPVVTPLFNSDSDSATNTGSLHSEFESPKDAQPSSGTEDHYYDDENDSKECPSADDDSYEMAISRGVGPAPNVTRSKDGDTPREYYTDDEPNEPFVEESCQSRLISEEFGTGSRDIPSRTSVSSKDSDDTSDDSQSVSDVSTPPDIEIDPETNSPNSEMDSHEVGEMPADASHRFDEYIEIDTESMQLEYEELENEPTPLLDWMPLLNWTAPTARAVYPAHIINMPDAVARLLDPDSYNDSIE